MSIIGKSVYLVHDTDNIQFGNVINERMEGAWRWVQINWINGAPTNKYKAPNIDVKNNWFRIDTLKIFEPVEMIDNLRNL